MADVIRGLGDEQLVRPYWSIDLPGMSESNAGLLFAWAKSRRISLGGSTVDPSWSFSSHLDDATVTALAEALALALRSGELPPETSIIVRGFTEQLTDWAQKQVRRPGARRLNPLRVLTAV